ncbi:BAB2_0123 family type IV secretion system effector [Bartonella sp. LJL80]
MAWFTVNIVSAVLAMVSLGVFIVTTRKLASTIRLGRELAQQVHSATSSLDRAVMALREEHQDFRDENRKLDARITESARIRRDVDRSVAHMENVRNQLQGDFNRLRGILTAQAHGPAAASGPAHPAVAQPMQAKGLPVFVQRKVHKTALGNKVQF